MHGLTNLKILHVYIMCHIRIAIWSDTVCVADVKRGTTQLVKMRVFLSGHIWALTM